MTRFSPGGNVGTLSLLRPYMSDMYEEILVPIDGSDPSLRAVDEAAALAVQHDAHLHVLHVIDLAVLVDVPDTAVLDSIEETAEGATDRAVARAKDAGAEEVRRSVHRGTPHRTILEYVDDHDVDLVVMGTHGRTGLNRLLLGSVTEKVVRLSPVPVLTVRGEETAEREEEADETTRERDEADESRGGEVTATETEGQ